jgi:hypothetical protein
MCLLLLKRTQSTFTAWVQTLNTRDDGREDTHTQRSCRKHQSLSLYGLLFTGRHLLGAPFIASLESNFCTALSTQNNTGNNCIISQAQNKTALQPNAFVTGIHRYWSQLTDGEFPPKSTTAKVNCKLHSHYVHLVLMWTANCNRILCWSSEGGANIPGAGSPE